MRFGQYELFGRIAVGGMAEIYRGRALGEEGFEKPVAIKRVLPHLARDQRFVSMLLTEARIHSALSHRNIVQIHDLGISEEGEYFIVLEYVDGRDLGALLEMLSKAGKEAVAGRPTDAVALHIVIELGEGVHFAHELRGPDGQPLGLVHRDISPSNVLISYAGEVKLSDFGLAKRRTDQSVVGSLKGKLTYMSPEQARRAPLDRRTDIFSLGAVLFELLTGRRLRDITDDVSGWQQVASGLVPSVRRHRPDLPAPLEQLLAGALAPDPRDRFADVRALVAAARAALDTVPRPPEGEAAALQELLRSLLPPGSPRPAMERSKVIRLVSHFGGPGRPGPGRPAQADHTVRAPAPNPPTRRPTPTRGAPAAGPTPPGRPGSPSPVPRPRVDADGAGEVPGPAAPSRRSRPGTTRSDLQPPPVPAVAGAGRSESPQRTPPATRGPGDRRTSTGAHQVIARRPTPMATALPAGEYGGTLGPLRQTAPAHRLPSPTPLPASTPLPAPARTAPPPPAPRGDAPSSAPSRQESHGRAPAVGPSSSNGAAAHPARGQSLPPMGRPSGGAGLPDLATSAGQHGSPAPFSSVEHGEALLFGDGPVEPLRRGRAGRFGKRRLLATMTALSVLAAIVHFVFVPLPLLGQWGKPARLDIVTFPPGAQVFLDGQRLEQATPTFTSVKRDRRRHVIELRKDGFQTARQTVRFDHAEILSVQMTLQPARRPSYEPIPNGAQEQTAATQAR